MHLRTASAHTGSRISLPKISQLKNNPPSLKKIRSHDQLQNLERLPGANTPSPRSAITHEPRSEVSETSRTADCILSQEPKSLLTSVQSNSKKERDTKRIRRPSPRLHVKGYTIGRTLGEGAFGKVKFARRGAGGPGLVVKIMEKKGIDDLKRVDQIFGEMFILTSLRHKNVIQLYDVINQFNNIILVMEFAEGGELSGLIEKNLYLAETHAARLFTQIYDGLVYCHRLKVIHRDLKLENILLDSEGNIKIVDFGLSERLLGDAKLDSICGTPLYMSPELMKGEKYDGSTDVWSLGVVLYAMVCGFLPFSARNLPDLSAKVCNGFYTIPSFLSESLADLIQSMLTVKPMDRLSLESIQNHRWAMDYEFLSGERKEIRKLTYAELAVIKADCHRDADERLHRKRQKSLKLRGRSDTVLVIPSSRGSSRGSNRASPRSPRRLISPANVGGEDALSKLVQRRGIYSAKPKKPSIIRSRRASVNPITQRRSPTSFRRRWKSPASHGSSGSLPDPTQYQMVSNRKTASSRAIKPMSKRGSRKALEQQ